MRFLALTLCLSLVNGILAGPLYSEEKNSELIVQDALEKTEKTGIKIGMTQDEVINLLGKDYSQEKINADLGNEKVYTWRQNDTYRISVTFSGDKVKALSHITKKVEE